MALKTFAGGALFGDQIGSGDPRVLTMHGWGRDRSDFGSALEGLEALSLDLPGFGASPPPPEGVGAAWYAGQIRPVLESLEVPPLVVGHSFGGRVAVVAAARWPELVGGVLFIGVPLMRRDDRPPAKSPLAYRLVKAAHRLGILSAQRLEAARSRYGSADYRAASGVMRDVLVTVVNESYEDELAALSCPVGFLWGADDQEVPVSVAERAAALVSDVPVETIDGVGHHVPVRSPDRVRAAIDRMLA